METMEGSEGTSTKISDSAYSNSCGNSQSHRSGSSKSRHSGSNSSGSSGYGGKGSSSATNSNDATPSTSSKRAKEKKNKKFKSCSTTNNINEISTSGGRGNERSSENDDRNNNMENTSSVINFINDMNDSPVDEGNPQNGDPPSSNLQQLGVHAADLCLPIQKQDFENASIEGLSPVKADEHTSVCAKSQCTTLSRNFQQLPTHTDGFSCVISMCEGVVLYTNSSITHALGYPQDMWLGRSFNDFIHPKDRPLFGSQITLGVASAFVETSAAENSEVLPRATLYCRIRRYRGIKSTNAGASGYGVRERDVCYAPFQLNLSFRDAAEFDDPNLYLVIKAYSVVSPYADGKLKTKKFTTRHTAAGSLTHVEPVAYLGYLPQDVVGRSIFDFYHPEDMLYLKEVYENLSKSEKVFRSKPYRFCTQNGEYLTVESDFSSFINPWSKKLEFVMGCHNILQLPHNTDVFQFRTKQVRMFSDDVVKQSKIVQDEIVRFLLEKKPDCAKITASKRCKDMTMFMERLVSECERPDKELKLEVPEDTSLSVGCFQERDSVMLGEISPHHDYYDSKSSTETPPSYNQLNYNENLQRFFESRPFTTGKDNSMLDEKINDHTDKRNDVMIRYRKSRRLYSGSGESGSSSMSVERIYPASNHDNTSHNLNNIESYKPAYLTEELLQKHNNVMENMLVKKHKRSSFKAEDRDKGEKKEKKLSNLRNLAAANHTYTKHGTAAFIQGIKRSGSSSWDQRNNTHKVTKLSTSNPSDFSYLQDTVTTTGVPSFPLMSNMNTTNTPAQMYTSNGQNQYPGMYPAVYLISQKDHPQDVPNFQASNQYPVPYMMYPPAMFTSQPFLLTPHMAMAYQPITLNSSVQGPAPIDTSNSVIPPVGLPYNNYQQACQVTVTVGKANKTAIRNHIKKLNSQYDQLEFTDTSTVVQRGSLNSQTFLNRGKFNLNKSHNTCQSKERVEIDNDESSYSSFYSSFLKTETSNSTDDSGGERGNLSSSKDKESSNESKSCITIDSSSKSVNKKQGKVCDERDRFSSGSDNNAQKSSFNNRMEKRCQKFHRNHNPPWLEEVNVTPELIYRYQVTSQNVEDVLKSDFNFLKSTTQPTLVNEQLSQLYMELQLDGFSDKLALDESSTSNSSSEEEGIPTSRHRTSYGKLVMIYEEDAPMPPPLVEEV